MNKIIWLRQNKSNLNWKGSASQKWNRKRGNSILIGLNLQCPALWYFTPLNQKNLLRILRSKEKYCRRSWQMLGRRWLLNKSNPMKKSPINIEKYIMNKWRNMPSSILTRSSTERKYSAKTTKEPSKKNKSRKWKINPLWSLPLENPKRKKKMHHKMNTNQLAWLRKILKSQRIKITCYLINQKELLEVTSTSTRKMWNISLD